MSRYLRSDSVRKALIDRIIHPKDETPYEFVMSFKGDDAVDIVHCEECKYYSTFSYKDHESGSCSNVIFGFDDYCERPNILEMDYCSWGGERKEDE